MKVYHSEAAKFRELDAMKYVVGRVADVGCGSDKITPDAIGFDGRPLDGVTTVDNGLRSLRYQDNGKQVSNFFNTIFSSHFLEHVRDPFEYLHCWSSYLEVGGHLVLYMPQKCAYNSSENLEHMFDWCLDDFLFFFKRCLCGEGKTYTGDHWPKTFEVVDSGLDLGENKYSFYLVAKKV